MQHKQSIYYSASSLYMFWVSTTPIIRGTQNCNYSLRYCAAASLQHGHFMFPCIVILGLRNPKRCNNTQIFIYC